MPEMILPGVYIDVRAEKLITPGRVTVGNVGVVGTASKGAVNTPILLDNYADARQRFGDYDSFLDNGAPRANSLTLVRALEQVFANGATTVFAVRVAGTGGNTPVKASHMLESTTGDCVSLTAKTEGKWGDDLGINVSDATEDAVIENESVPTSGGDALTLKRTQVVKNSRNRVTYFNNASGVTRTFSGNGILYDDVVAAPTADQVKIDRATGLITFFAAPDTQDKITASYIVDKANARRVTIRLNEAEEVYTIVDGNDLKDDINSQSAWVDAKAEANANEIPDKSTPADGFAAFKGGANGEQGADYKGGLEQLENEDVHIIVAGGQDDSFGDELDQHCQKASTDLIKRDRIAVVGSKTADVNDLRGHTLSSDRLIFVAPGIKVTDAASAEEVTLPGTYTAAAIAGMLSARDPHVSLTNKPVPVGGLEEKYSQPELKQLVQARVLAIEVRRGAGIRIVKAITTDGGAFRQITTRRIVDYAKFSVRSAAEPYIGLLNNERVRGAMRATINSSLAEMVDDEMLVSYDLTVTATRDEEIKGIARVTITLRPTFSIDFIKVTMFLE